MAPFSMGTNGCLWLCRLALAQVTCFGNVRAFWPSVGFVKVWVCCKGRKINNSKACTALTGSMVSKPTY